MSNGYTFDGLFIIGFAVIIYYLHKYHSDIRRIKDMAIDSQTGIAFDYYEDGKIRQIIEWKNAHEQYLHGTWKKYWNNGDLSCEAMVDRGTVIGEVRNYHENGQLRSVVNYRRDDDGASKAFGEAKHYDSEGKLEETVHYYKGRIVQLTEYDPEVDDEEDWIQEVGDDELDDKIKTAGTNLKLDEVMNIMVVHDETNKANISKRHDTSYYVDA